MMNSIRDRLESQDGISLLYGLMFLLVAVMVAVTVLNAATASAERVSNDRTRQQNYLALNSAGRLISDCLQDDSFFTTITTVTTDEDPDAYTITVATQPGPLHDQIEPAMITATGAVTSEKPSGSIPAEAHGSFTVNVPEQEGLDYLSGAEVDVAFSLQERHYGEEIAEGANPFKITAMLTLKGTNQKMYMSATRADAAAPTTTTTAGVTTSVEQVKWTSVTLSTRGEAIK